MEFIEKYSLLIAVIIIWEMIWKGVALWRAGRNNQRYWFVALLVINTIGILEIVYLKFFQKKPSHSHKS
ncbi:MAG: hypothetical protein UU80_C0002G0027 [candidate division WWE3 bacterium GW2011_GWA1_41_8]|uniref:DUF5652 domain-containing protein n=2 Tax=Katanobacteria TaxID=422282 RepID=A0A0G0XD48_UNCKA|nr:MAG: hypothetical protein UU72_C0004G0032 [candidate division WWE3 bacterium GW2011_GWB1_41_6]KKS22795.1 MAG: hypothetical protein UU80_C0002G0027 [candidate division WWE3 bacterium GW2011_GWA1_41_8]